MTDLRPAVTVIGTNLVIDYGTAEAAWKAFHDALEAPPAPGLREAIRDVFRTNAWLIHHADDPKSNYDPLARETAVLAAFDRWVQERR